MAVSLAVKHNYWRRFWLRGCFLL